MRLDHPMTIVAAAALSACAALPRTETPAALSPGVEQSLVRVVAARGVQIYECRSGAGGPEWMFVAPEAALLDIRGRTVGRHGAGPHWQASDGSRIVGIVKARADAPLPGAIPWLLLGTKSTGPQGAFSGVTSIQRVNTSGGVAPANGCTSTTTGSLARVPYTADYRLFSHR